MRMKMFRTSGATYVNWTNYTLFFDSNGGSQVAEQSVPYMTSAVEPKAPKKVGYTFAGWYKDSAFTKRWNFISDIVTENMTLYAKWLENFTFSFDSSGGSHVENHVFVYNTSVTTFETGGISEM